MPSRVIKSFGTDLESDVDRVVEEFSYAEGSDKISRKVHFVDGRYHRTYQTVPSAQDPIELKSSFDLSWLNSARSPQYRYKRSQTVRLADLFCGAGGLTLGVLEAGRALGIQVTPVLAADTAPHARRVYSNNFSPELFESRPIEELLDGKFGAKPTGLEKRLLDQVGQIDMVVGGPPCQGHSNLNNYTRRDDPKNSLYGRLARFAELFRPDYVIIENVYGAVYDSGGIVQDTRRKLEELDYAVDIGMLYGERIGVPQTRHRVFLVAASHDSGLTPEIRDWENLHSAGNGAHRTFDWACRDLIHSEHVLLDQETVPKPQTVERINWLHDQDKYELPNERRPGCHRDKEHTYVSVYGRIRPNLPAPTVTTGFTCMGQGRFVHPYYRRTLTPREGMRLQFLPDWFSFDNCNLSRRTELLSLIGNAVPPKMGYVLALELFRRHL
jgi:DNA (cytosine-5)-methyltransferase 1